jgi:divalent metal cation (Fe/Co/Zn/Cd) transporter
MSTNNELKDLKRINEASLFSVLLLIPITLIISRITGSITLWVVMLWAFAALLVKIFALVSIRIMMKQNRFMFPFGTGKIENFSSFLFGLVTVPFAIYFLIISSFRLISPIAGISYLLCQVPVAVSFIRSVSLSLWTRRILRRTPNPSPLLKANDIDFKICLITDAFMFLAFLSGTLSSFFNLQLLSVRVDPFLTVILSVYMLWTGIPLIVENIRSLFDLPLPEPDMLKILKVSTEFIDGYHGFGMIYSRQSGKNKIAEIELLFDQAVNLSYINQLENKMASRMNDEIPGISFRLIPKLLPPIN